MIEGKGLYIYFDEDDSSWVVYNVRDTHVPERDEDFTSFQDFVWVANMIVGDQVSMQVDDDSFIHRDSYFSTMSEPIVGDMFYRVFTEVFELKIKF